MRRWTEKDTEQTREIVGKGLGILMGAAWIVLIMDSAYPGGPQDGWKAFIALNAFALVGFVMLYPLWDLLRTPEKPEGIFGYRNNSTGSGIPEVKHSPTPRCSREGWHITYLCPMERPEYWDEVDHADLTKGEGR